MFRDSFERDTVHEGLTRRRGDRRRLHHRAPGHRRGPGPDSIPVNGRGARGGWGRGRIRRGEIRPLILAALATRPMHGYEIIQELEAQSGGRWRPSAGSVYPTLQQLADEGLVTGDELDGRRTYTLTDEGRAAAEANPASARWSERTGDAEPDLRMLGHQLIGAVMQVQRMGSAHARSETTRILTDARRQVYRLLADDDAGPTSAGEAVSTGTATSTRDEATNAG